jgi:hypothetical protein
MSKIKNITKNIIILGVISLFLFGAIQSFGNNNKCDLKTLASEFKKCSVEDLKIIKKSLESTKKSTDEGLLMIDSLIIESTDELKK